MKKIIKLEIILLLFILFFLGKIFLNTSFVFSNSNTFSGYTISNFESKIILEKDTSLKVEERIQVNFEVPKHGIFRIIPLVYSSGLKTIKAKIKVISVTNEQGQIIPYTLEYPSGNLKIKIGDPNKTLIGPQTYIISYQIKRVVLTYPEWIEIYWNITGSQWDTVIKKAQAIVISNFAEIKKVDCFAGNLKTKEKFCWSTFNKNKAYFEMTQPGGYGRDFTIVVGLSKNNQLIFPGIIQKITWLIEDYFGYLASLLPLFFILIAWWLWGRDFRFLTDNIYYLPEEKDQKKVSLFERSHLPLVYHPINHFTPAQIGTIYDEKVNLKDIVGEIVELGRLGYLKIKKISRKKFFGNENDYLFIKIDKDLSPLKEYQRFLLEKIFKSKNEVKISQLKNKFYIHLEKLENLIYESLTKEEKVFPENPKKTKRLWLFFLILISIISLFLVLVYYLSTGNFGSLIILFLSIFLAKIFSQKMVRKTAWGYSVYSQIKGLRWYLEKAKWREEIAEKNLFFEEMLPLAIVLGIVNKLVKEMAELGSPPPSYFEGITNKTLPRDLNNFYRLASISFSSSPVSAGKRSSWSGGSGFSGRGSVGGGFGGGGGGSW